MEMPKTFFAELAEKSPLIIFDHQLYQLTERDISENFIKVGEKKFGLIASDSLLNLENFYRYVNAQEIFNFKKDYIKGKLNSNMKSNEEINRIIKDNMVLYFILNEVFPYFTETKDNVAALLKGRQEKEIGILDGNIEKIIADASKEFDKKESVRSRAKPVVERDNKRLVMSQEDGEIYQILTKYYKTDEREKKPATKNMRSLLSVVLNDQNVLVFGNQVNKLSRLRIRNNSELAVVIDGIEYMINPFDTVQNIENLHRRKLEEQLMIESEEDFNYQNNVTRQIDGLVRQLKEYSQKNEFEMGDIGFVKQAQNYYVTLKVSPYVLKEVKLPDKDMYFKFDECKVAVNIIYNDGKIQTDTVTFVVEAYQHPFLARGKQAWTRLCMGNYNPAVSLNGLNEAGRVVKLLSDAKNVMQKGYTLSCRPYQQLFHGSGLENNHPYNVTFASQKIDLDEIKRKNLPITNIDLLIEDKKKREY